MPRLPILCLFLLTAPAWAQVPGWWAEQGVIAPGSDPLDADTNALVANLGQAKHLALGAYQAMEARGAGSAGPSLDALAADLLASAGAAVNFAPLQEGALKALAAPFYERFAATAYRLPPHLVINTDGYPWGADPARAAAPLAPVNLGQLKYVFSFDLADWPPVVGDPDAGEDRDGDGLDDLWEWALIQADPNDAYAGFGDITPTSDFDGDGLSDGEEFLTGANPQQADHPAVQLQVFTRLN